MPRAPNENPLGALPKVLLADGSQMAVIGFIDGPFNNDVPGDPMYVLPQKLVVAHRDMAGKVTRWHYALYEAE